MFEVQVPARRTEGNAPPRGTPSDDEPLHHRSTAVSDEAQVVSDDQEEGMNSFSPFSPLPPRSPESFDEYFRSRKVLLPHMSGLTYDDLDGVGRAEVHKRWVDDQTARRPFRFTATPMPPRVLESTLR